MGAYEKREPWDWKDLDPRRLSKYLVGHGWERSGGRDGLYERYRFSTGESSHEQFSVILPLDPSWADYSELLDELRFRVEALGHTEALLHSEELERIPGDELKFRKDVATVGGAVAWSSGKDLIWAAENILLAGAKTRLSRRAYYGQASGRFAHRFLDSVLMGQTEIGSYVVTAFAPAHESFPDKAPKTDAPSIGG